MKTKILLLFILISFTQLHAQYNNKNLQLAPEVVATKFTYGNMRIYPVYANEDFLKINSDKNKYLTLKDALAKKQITVSEKLNSNGDNSEVNSLVIQNLSNDSVMILGGEVIEGGKQDRMIASDIILPPKSGKVDLNVYCVEHGRWNTKGSGSSTFMFNSSPATLFASPNIRAAGAVSKDQQKVWNEVKDVTTKNACVTATGTYTSLKTDTTFNKKISGYRAFFTSIVKSDPKLIGFVAVTGNRIVGCDLFANHTMIVQHASDLINSYATEAISNGSKVTVSYQSVKSYIDKFLANEKTQDKMLEDKGTILRDKGKKVHISFY